MRVDGLAVVANLEVQACAGLPAGVTDLRNRLAGLDPVARFFEQFLVVAVQAHVAAAVIDDEKQPEPLQPIRERDSAMGRLAFTTQLSDLSNVDLVIEAVTEELGLKNSMFRELDEICGPEAVFASNTSSLTIADMAAATGRPDRMLGLHFFNPVPVMKLVEVVRTIATSDDAYQTAYAFAKTIGKEPVEAKDSSGFIVNRLLVPYMLDAIRCLEQGLASIEDIDKSMVLGTGYPMGPFVLCDFVGIDTLYKISEIMFDEFREPRFAPPPLLKRMVTMGYYGRKSKKGFYDYSASEPKAMNLGI
jgi:3-hydroxybutyryl-CoA dehydrogenase